MIRILLCVATVMVVSFHVVVARAAPDDALGDGASRSGVPVQHYAQADRGRIAAPAPRQRSPQSQFPTRVYLLRGFMNVFSLGMDDLGARIQAAGIAATVTSHAEIDLLVPQIVARYQGGDHGAIVLIGHSLGADAVIDMAQALDRYGVPVAAAILFDGTAPHAVPGNVAVAINYTLHFMLSPGPGFNGTLNNVNLSGDPGMDHLYIDKAPALQAQALNYVLQAARAPAPAPAPAMRRP